MPPLEFVNLTCPKCDSMLFMPLVHLKHRAGGGLVADPAGWACVQCLVPVDAQKALEAYQLRQKREELRQLETELGVHHASGTGKVPSEDHTEG